MKHYVVKILSLLMACLLCFGLLACTTPETPDDQTSDQPSNDGPEDTPGKEEENKPDDTPDDIPDDVPEGKVELDIPTDGVAGEFNVLHYTTGNHEWTNPWDEIVPSSGMEVAPGDLIGDDIFDRTAWIEEEYGITVACDYVEYMQLPTMLAQIIKTGSTEYQLVDTMGHSAQKLMGQEFFMNMAELPYVDFDHPWWVDNALEELSLGNYVEFAVSDMLLIDKSATMVLFYNIDMAKDLELDSIYDDVRNYAWTIERMAEYASLALQPNGDDVMDKNDIYGLITNDDPVHMLYLAAGRKFMSRDEDGLVYYSYGTDDTYTVMIDNLNTIMYADFTWNNHLMQDAPTFVDGSSLFTFDKLKRCMLIRDMVDDYGILPLPMYDEEQQEYYGPVSSYHDSMFAVINTNINNQETIGAALELLSYFSYYEIYSDFYEVVIQNRGTRDAESKEMLSIIFENRAYDIGLLYDPLSLMDKVLRITATGEAGVASQWDGLASQREETIDRLNTLIEQYN